MSTLQDRQDLASRSLLKSAVDELELTSIESSAHQYCQSASGKVLLIADALIRCNYYVEFDFGCRQQSAVVDFTPSHFIGSGDRVARQRPTKWRWSAVVK
jgi:hypothetical protein